MKTNRSDNRINTMLGELIATVSKFAFEYSASPGSKIIDRPFPGTMLLH